MLLSISIPTYQRAQYLDLCLQRILQQINPEISGEIEIIISDNNSQDNTSEIVRKHMENNRNVNIRYSKNDKNIGLDGNITEAYKLANGQFVMVFGDDDVLIDGSLIKIYHILKSNPEVGIVYVESFGFTKNYKDFIPRGNNGTYKIYRDRYAFFKKVNYYFTYTSGNIINKTLMPNNFDVNRFLGTNLNLLNWIVTAILNSKYNIYIQDRLIGTKTENTGGYGFCETFAKNGNFVFNSFIHEDKVPRKFFEVINNRMLVNYFPYLINLFKDDSKNYFKEDYHSTLSPIYSKNPLYLFFCYPAIIFPTKISSRLLFFNNWYRRLLNVKIRIIDDHVAAYKGHLMVCKIKE